MSVAIGVWEGSGSLTKGAGRAELPDGVFEPLEEAHDSTAPLETRHRLHADVATTAPAVGDGYWEWAEGNRAESWIGRFTRQMRAFAGLSADWNSNGAPPPNAQAILVGTQILEVLWGLGAKPSRIAPTASGGVVIAFLGERVRANLECYNTGEILAAIIKPGEPADVWEVEHDRSEIREALQRLIAATETRPTT